MYLACWCWPSPDQLTAFLSPCLAQIVVSWESPVVCGMASCTEHMHIHTRAHTHSHRETSFHAHTWGRNYVGWAHCYCNDNHPSPIPLRSSGSTAALWPPPWCGTYLSSARSSSSSVWPPTSLLGTSTRQAATLVAGATEGEGEVWLPSPRPRPTLVITLLMQRCSWHQHLHRDCTIEVAPPTGLTVWRWQCIL